MTSEINNLARRRTSYIEIYSFSNGPYNTTKNPTIKFPAFLTDFSDSYKSQFSSESVYGKMDPIATFKNTSRTITLNFDIPSVSAADAKENLSKISYLIRGLYPVYDEGTKGTAILASPPMFRVRFANFVRNAANNDSAHYALRNGLLCYIESFDFKPNKENGFFVNNATEELFPKLISVSLALKIIHEHALGNRKSGNTTEPRVSFNKFPYVYTTPVAKTTEAPPPPPQASGLFPQVPPTTNYEWYQEPAKKSDYVTADGASSTAQPTNASGEAQTQAASSQVLQSDAGALASYGPTE